MLFERRVDGVHGDLVGEVDAERVAVAVFSGDFGRVRAGGHQQDFGPLGDRHDRQHVAAGNAALHGDDFLLLNELVHVLLGRLRVRLVEPYDLDRSVEYVPVEIVDGDLRAVVTVLALHRVRAGFREQHSELDGFLSACGHHERRFQVEDPGCGCGARRGGSLKQRAAIHRNVGFHGWFPPYSSDRPGRSLIRLRARRRNQPILIRPG